jgi:kinesin family protein C2/C3
MDGQDGAEGVNVRALGQLFNILAARNSHKGGGGETSSSTVRIAAVEIYNETPRDLLIDPKEYKKHLALVAGGSEPTIAKLEIHQNPAGSIHIPGLLWKEVTSVADIKATLASHVRVNRATAATAMNDYSSRSHLVLFVDVETESSCVSGSTASSSAATVEKEIERTHGRLVLIDLAGSERVKRSEAVGQALKEASHINKSLSALGDVMAALRRRSNGEDKVHIPYRNSKVRQKDANSNVLLLLLGDVVEFMRIYILLLLFLPSADLPTLRLPGGPQ